MPNLEYLNYLYSSTETDLTNNEHIYIQGIKKYKDWLSKSDHEKLESRKSYLEMVDVHFQDDWDREYQKQTVVVIEMILNFVNEYSGPMDEFENPTEEEKTFFRIYNMLWCEKEYLFLGENLRATRIHVSYEIFESLVSKVRGTSTFDKYNLTPLFSENRKMIELFDSLSQNRHDG